MPSSPRPVASSAVRVSGVLPAGLTEGVLWLDRLRRSARRAGRRGSTDDPTFSACASTDGEPDRGSGGRNRAGGRRPAPRGQQSAPVTVRGGTSVPSHRPWAAQRTPRGGQAGGRRRMILRFRGARGRTGSRTEAVVGGTEPAARAPRTAVRTRSRTGWDFSPESHALGGAANAATRRARTPTDR